MNTENKILFEILLDLLEEVEETNDPITYNKAQQAHVLASSLYGRLNQPSTIE